MKLGIFGGTFNPIHLGHLAVAEDVRRQLELDRIIFVPSHIPPHKALADDVTAAKRLEMVRLATAANPHFSVDSFECDQGGKSYSLKTIEHIRDAFDVTPHFIMGQDAFELIATWHRPEKILALSHLIVMSRPGSPRKSVEFPGYQNYESTEWGFMSPAGLEIRFLDVVAMQISSSEIRQQIKNDDHSLDLVPDEVRKYIIDERLYR